jgi:exodeoxyribonuclease III
VSWYRRRVLVATWNVNGVRARAQRLAEWLEERKPDVACLQELKIVEDEFPHLELRASGYHAVLVGQQGWNGVAVIARERPEAVVRELPGASEIGARFLVARACGLEIASVYVPNGKSVSHADYRVKLTWLDRLAAFLESRADRDAPLVVGGDFNVCPADMDSFAGVRWRGRVHHTDEERALVGRLRDAGLVDLYRARYTDDPGFSWWDYRAGCFHKNQGMRIDLLLATPAVASRVKDVFVDRDYRKKGKTSGSIPSDHAPVVARLD